MKVFQIIKCVGCYEDYHEYVQATYLHKEKAERELAKLKASVPDCDECPYAEEGQEAPIKTDCPLHSPKYHNFSGYKPYYNCENCIDSYDAPSYKMKEYEIDDGWDIKETDFSINEWEVEIPDHPDIGKRIREIVYAPLDLRIILDVRNGDEIYVAKIVTSREVLEQYKNKERNKLEK